MCHTETFHYICHNGVSHVLRTTCGLHLANPNCPKTYSDSYTSEGCSDCKGYQLEEEHEEQSEWEASYRATIGKSKRAPGGVGEGFDVDEEEDVFELEEVDDYVEFLEDKKKGKREDKKRANVAAKANSGGKGGGRAGHGAGVGKA